VNWKESLSGWKGPILGLIFGLIGAGIGSLASNYISTRVMEQKVETLCSRFETLSDAVTGTKIEMIILSTRVEGLVEVGKANGAAIKEQDNKLNSLMRFKRKMEKSWIFGSSIKEE